LDKFLQETKKVLEANDEIPLYIYQLINIATNNQGNISYEYLNIKRILIYLGYYLRYCYSRMNNK